MIRIFLIGFILFVTSCGKPNEIYFNKPPSKVVIPVKQRNSVKNDLILFRKKELQKIGESVKDNFSNIESWENQIENEESIDELLNALKN